MTNEEKFQNIVNNFLESNEITNSSERYVKNFPQKMGKFLGQNKLKENLEISNLLLYLMQFYTYYSREKVEKLLKDFYEDLILNINEEYTIYSPIPSEKDVSRANSSNFYLNKFFEINDLSNDQQLSLIALYLDVENKAMAKELKKPNRDTNAEIIKVYGKLSYIETIVCIDDFSGTGKTIKKFLKVCADMISEKEVIIYVIHITKKAYETIIQAFEEFGYTNAKLRYTKIQTSIFLKGDDYLNHVLKSKLLTFEKNIINSKNPLGYGETEALCTFYRNCPNNTISSYWWDEDEAWNALFPRTNNQTIDFHGNKKHSAIRENINYNLSLIVPKHLSGTYDIKELMYLVYLNNHQDSFEKIEIKQILRYNDSQLLELRHSLLKKDFINESDFLTDIGLEFLKKLNLNKTLFSKLTQEIFVRKTEDSLTVDNFYMPKIVEGK